MNFNFTDYDEDGKPTMVCTDDGFMRTSRPFKEEEDGWMIDQLDPRDFEVIRIGRQVQMLVDEVNHLRRENFNHERFSKKIFSNI